MHDVSLVRSIAALDERCVGATADLKSRRTAHNAGQSVHTAKFKPWILFAYSAFNDEPGAIAFEKFLKSGSGRAFANKHLW